MEKVFLLPNSGGKVQREGPVLDGLGRNGRIEVSIDEPGTNLGEYKCYPFNGDEEEFVSSQGRHRNWTAGKYNFKGFRSVLDIHCCIYKVNDRLDLSSNTPYWYQFNTVIFRSHLHVYCLNIYMNRITLPDMRCCLFISLLTWYLIRTTRSRRKQLKNHLCYSRENLHRSVVSCHLVKKEHLTDNSDGTGLTISQQN